MLIGRGMVEATAPVAKYWPEFAANGKQNIEFRHLLSHTSGLSGWEQPCVSEDIYALTYGHLIGEVLRRVTGKTLKQFVHEEIAGPLDADFQIGASPQDVARVAEIIPSANGHGSARALVRILSVISLGGKVNGVRLLQPETIEKIFDVQSDGPDVVLLGHPLRWGLGSRFLNKRHFRTSRTGRSASGAAGVVHGRR
jgi:CubicO group peptidase (beta-lactamase class C family)